MTFRLQACATRAVVYVVAVCILSCTLIAHKADAAVIIQRPLYVGLTNGLVGYWSFDGADISNDRAFDRSGAGNDGTLTPPSGGGPTRTKGRLGQGLSFDGANDYVSLGTATALDITGDVSVSAWIYHRTSTGADIVVSKGCSQGVDGCPWQIRVSGADDLCFDFENAAGTQEAMCTTTGPIPLNQWAHVTIVRSGSNKSIYLNGALILGPTAQSLTPDTNGDEATIGSDLSGGHGDFFDGTLDDVRIYNRALSQDEIKRLYKIGGTMTIGKAPDNSDTSLGNGLVGYWSFDGADISNTRAFDRSGQGNDGTLTNGPLRVKGKLGQGLEFDKDVSQYVNVGDASAFSANTTNQLTVAAWTKLYENSAARTIVAKGGGAGATSYEWMLRYHPAAGADMVIFINQTSTNCVDVGKVVTINEWHHIVSTIDLTTQQVKLFVDGVLVDTDSTASCNLADTAGLFRIGMRGDNGFPFDGTIDDVRIYNRALSGDEIRRLYNMGHIN